ncbi:hypothetical protein CRE_11183 [Caenorhabditis remanei]|uniref:Uncharacterized protein n=1 Tax=Caenorhabditis remanei TaxID=31234 RepID=E3MQ84_CAERE|nr:hypothetical protein CRE_11183 [Caenorhabditis remanei]
MKNLEHFILKTSSEDLGHKWALGAIWRYVENNGKDAKSRNCYQHALVTFEETASTYEEDYLDSTISPENAYIRTMSLCKHFSEFLRIHPFGFCQGVGHFVPVIPRENIDYGEANRQIFDSTDKMVFSGVVDISGRSLRVGEGQPMLPCWFTVELWIKQGSEKYPKGRGIMEDD